MSATRRTYLAATIRPDLDQFPADQKALIQEITTRNPLAQAAYVRAIPGSPFVEVPGTTHYVHTQRPDVVIAAINDAVAGTTMTSPPVP